MKEKIMRLPKIKYRNTGFMRQVFIYWNGRYKGVEFNKRYFREYKLTNEGVLPKYRDLWRRKE